MILESKSPETFSESFRWGEEILLSAGISNAKMEALWIYRACENNLSKFSRMVMERKSRKPLSYILGTQDFMGKTFFVDESVLIPRPETEVLLHEAVRLSENRRGLRIHDLCTGSGILAVALAEILKFARVSASDISPNALAVAGMNASFHKVRDRVEFMESDLLESVKIKFDMIVSNPPYVRSAEIQDLEPEILHEPRIALDGGPDGLIVIRKIVSEACQFIEKGGHLLMEVGYDQAEKVSDIFERNGFKNVRAAKDDAGIERTVIGEIS